MGWNDPGKGNGKNPWGNQQGDGLPPELDEAVRKMQERFSRFMGGNKTGRNTGKSGSPRFFVLIAAIIVAIVLLSGFYVIEAGWQGVVLRFGAYQTTTDPGLHWAVPLVDDVLKVNVAKVRILEIGYRTGGGAVPREGLMLTQDENIVDVRLAVQYQISNARNFLFKVKNPVNAPDETIKQVAESALREVVGKSDMDFVITRGRKEISDRTADLIQNTLNEYESGIEIRSVNFQEAQPPGYVQAAFDDAVKSREDRERFINEANAYRNEVLPRAKGESARIMEDAEGYRARVVSEAEGDASRFLALFEEYEKAPEVTRQRLYIDAMKNVLSASGKVMIDLNRDNNLIVLPLDNLGRGSEDISSRILGAGVIQNSMNRDTDKQEVPAPEAQRLRRDIRQREVR